MKDKQVHRGALLLNKSHNQALTGEPGSGAAEAALKALALEVLSTEVVVILSIATSLLARRLLIFININDMVLSSEYKAHVWSETDNLTS